MIGNEAQRAFYDAPEDVLSAAEVPPSAIDVRLIARPTSLLSLALDLM